MKITLIRTDKSNKQHVSYKTLDKFLGDIATESVKPAILELRKNVLYLEARGISFKPIRELPRVYPAAVFKHTAGELQFQQYNGIVMLSIAGLATPDDVTKVKQLAAQLPMTVATIAGSSGRSVKILVAATDAKGSIPEHEEPASALYTKAFAEVRKLYEAMLGVEVSSSNDGLHSSFRLTADAAPYYNASAIPLRIDISNGQQTAPALSDATRCITQQTSLTDKLSTGYQNTDFKTYDDNEFLYNRVVQDVNAMLEKRGELLSIPDEAYYAEIATGLCRLGMPRQEAMLHISNHSWSADMHDHVELIVNNAYDEYSGKISIDSASQIRKSTRSLIEFLTEKYTFRYNTVMGYTEFRPNNSGFVPFRPADEKQINSLVIEARMAGINAWTKDVERYVKSAYITEYDPVNEYLNSCQNKWDGIDRIRELARQVPTDNKQWPDMFYTWFLGMVKQWQSGSYSKYGNATAPLLISSKQGIGKSTFCSMILPPELRWGYTDSLDLAEKRQVMQSMSQMLLINLDEFNKISADVQQGFLKNIIQLACVKVKRPYGRRLEEFPRMASFIATANMKDVLFDPTGNRRFICVEVTGQVNTDYRINYTQLYAQALEAIKNGEKTYFDNAETQQIVDDNREFEHHSPAESYFLEMFRPAESDEEGEWLSATAIFDKVKEKAGSSLHVSSLLRFGRVLANMPGLERKRTKCNTVYHVISTKK